MKELQECNNELREDKKKLASSNSELRKERDNLKNPNKQLDTDLEAPSKETEEKITRTTALESDRGEIDVKLKELIETVAPKDLEIEQEHKTLTTEKNTAIQDLENEKIEIDDHDKELSVIVVEKVSQLATDRETLTKLNSQKSNLKHQKNTLRANSKQLDTLAAQQKKEQLNNENPADEYAPVELKTKKEQFKALQTKVVLKTKGDVQEYKSSEQVETPDETEQVSDENPLDEYTPVEVKPKKEQFKALQTNDLSNTKVHDAQYYESSEQAETPDEAASGAISRNRIGGAFLGSSFVTVAGTMVAAIVNLLCNGAVIKMILTYPCLQPCFQKHKWFKAFLMFIFTYTAANPTLAETALGA
eukprot:225765_1